MAYVLLGIGVAAVLIFMMIQSYLEEKRRAAQFKKRLQKEYGTVLKYEYSEERVSALKGYYDTHEKSVGHVDDISWNDIDGERLFRRINYCYSSAGEEYLYYRLRNLQFDAEPEQMQVFEDKINWLDSHEEERIRMQIEFAKLGRTGKYSLFRYIDYLCQLVCIPAYRFLWIPLAYIITVILIFTFPQAGVFAIVGLFTALMFVHLKKKKEVEPYLISFKYIIRVLKLAERLGKHPVECWQEECSKLLELRKKVSGISDLSMSVFPTESSAGDALADSIRGFSNMLTHIDIFVFYRMLKQVNKNKDIIDEMVTLMGKMESQISIASFRRSLPHYAVPVFKDREGMKIVDGIHPLIEEAVPNSFDISGSMLLTGSNASGKSTFLKMVEICMILAQTIQTVPAKFYEAKEYRVYSSMSLRDDLESGESYYMVEIKAIKRILEAAKETGHPVAGFVDEVLRGTNTVERIAAASEIMESFTDNGMLSFAATHDIELTNLLAHKYDNYHFEEVIENDDILFPYILLEGPARTRNAIKLLRLMGYPDELTERADRRASELLKS